MQVLGDLVSMPRGTSLPLPWWHRAPLGLQSGTNCLVATIKNSSRVVPDVIVSVLRPTNDRLWISLTHREEPGVVMRVISQLTEVNITLAESATLEGGAYHQVTLVCEPKHDGASLPKASEIERQFAERGLEPHVRAYEQPHVVFEEPAIIRSGWIDNVDWHKFVKEDLTPASLATVDLSQAVVSADTKTRILRYVFSRLGSRTVRVRHRDQAGVLYMILAEIQQSGINMLSMVLKRGGAKANTAVLVAVCEPPADRSAEGVFYELKEKLDLFEPKYQIRVKIAASVKADSAVNPHENAAVVAHVPAELQKTVQRIRLTVRQNQLGIFLSHRLRRSQQSTGLEGEVRAAIQDSEAVPIELDPGASERSASYQEVSSGCGRPTPVSSS